MERSAHYWRRKWHMCPLTVPTISEVKEELGKDLAEVFFITCAEPLKPLLGLVPLLSGPPGDLWMSPSDILIQRVCLKPPLTEKHLKALTYQGVYLIGKDLEKKAKNEAEIAKQQALLEQEQLLLSANAASANDSLGKIIRQFREKCEEEKEVLRIEWTEKMQNDLMELENKLKTDYEQALKQQKYETDEKWQAKLLADVNEAVTKLTKSFLKELDEQEEELLKKFDLELKKEKLKHQFDLQEARKACKESFSQLKHQLQCKNIANIIYILCAERRKCRTEKNNMEHSYQKRMEYLQNAFCGKKLEVKKLTEEMNEKIQEMLIREKVLRELICEYHKFINLALRSYPNKAKFLMDPGRLMLFELAQNITNVKSKCGKPLAKDALPKKAESVTIKTIEKSDSLLAKNYCTCYHEFENFERDNDKSADQLPTLHYNKHMYVREDFGNMTLHELPVCRCNMIWSRDAKHLQPVEEPSEDSEESVKSDSTKSAATIETPCTTVEKPHKSLETDDHSESLDSKQMICNEKFHITEVKVKVASVQYDESDVSMLTKLKPCTRCTQTYFKPEYIRNMSDSESSTCINLQYPKDSLIKYRLSLKAQAAAKEKREEDIQLSKLSLARDSFIVHRHSLVVKRQHRAVVRGLAECKTASIAGTSLKSKKAGHKIMPTLSKLSLSKDSLELLRSQTMLTKQKVGSKESVEIQNGIVGKRFTEENDSRTVKVSHIEMIPLDDKPKKTKTGVTSFDSDFTVADSPWLTYAYKAKDLEKRKLLQKSDRPSAVGSQKLRASAGTYQDLALHRTSSMLCIFRKHPSLMRMFTICRQ